MVQMFVLATIAAILGVVIVWAIDWFPEQGARSSSQIDTLYDVLMYVSVPIFVLVMSVAIYSVWRFRARPGDMGDGEPIHGNTRLEVIWVAIPFLIVTSLAVYGWIVLDDIEAKKPNTLVVKVTGQQFTWSFEYPPQEGIGKPIRSSTLMLPNERPVEFQITAKDVIHSFWVPEFRLKQDAVPGLTTKTRLTPNRLDRYQVVCAELCGIGHSTMRQEVEVVPRERFDAWVAERGGAGMAAGAPPGSPQQAAAGKEVFNSPEAGCGGCHTFADAGSTGQVGPNLDELAAAAGRRKPGTAPEAYVEESIVRPDAFVVEGFPRGTMPSNFGQRLTPQEIDALVSYLLSGDKGGGAQ
jgi:cytochrome c oxidase subunit II